MPTNHKHVHTQEHTGRVRAAARALAQDVQLVLNDVPEEHLSPQLRSLFKRDVRRAHQVLKGVAS